MVGLTGGIGSGKSAAARRLAELGAVVVDADRIAREVVAPGTEGLAEIVAAFGDRVLAADGGAGPRRARRGGLRRRGRPAPAGGDHPSPGAPARSAELVAAAPGGRDRGQRRTAAGRGGAGGDVPPGDRGADGPGGPDRPADPRPGDDRRGGRAGGSPPRPTTRGAGRPPTSLLHNDGSLADLHAAVDRLWRDRLVPYERNLREGRAVRHPGPVLAPADPGWPAAVRPARRPDPARAAPRPTYGSTTSAPPRCRGWPPRTSSTCR